MPDDVFVGHEQALPAACDAKELSFALQRMLESAWEHEACSVQALAEVMLRLPGSAAYLREYELRMQSIPQGKLRARAVSAALAAQPR